jgi:hypothetical protein
MRFSLGQRQFPQVVSVEIKQQAVRVANALRLRLSIAAGQRNVSIAPARAALRGATEGEDIGV